MNSLKSRSDKKEETEEKIINIVKLWKLLFSFYSFLPKLKTKIIFRFKNCKKQKLNAVLNKGS